jgi:OOP family OmpA-OmpF porin
MKNTTFKILATVLLSSSFYYSEAQTLRGIGKRLGQKAEQFIDKKVDDISNATASQSQPTVTNSASQNGPFENLQGLKYDYLRGTEVVFEDNFSADELGTMAQRWTSNGKGSVSQVSIAEGKWLELFDGNTYKIKDLVRIPENFTIEFDVLALSDDKHQFRLDFGFDYQKGVGNHYYLAKHNPLNINASYWFNRFEFHSKEVTPNKNSEVKANMSYFVNDVMKVKIRVEGNRMHTYINEYKILDTEMVDPITKKYFYLAFNNDDKTGKIYISNFRIDKI